VIGGTFHSLWSPGPTFLRRCLRVFSRLYSLLLSSFAASNSSETPGCSFVDSSCTPCQYHERHSTNLIRLYCNMIRPKPTRATPVLSMQYQDAGYTSPNQCLTRFLSRYFWLFSRSRFLFLSTSACMGTGGCATPGCTVSISPSWATCTHLSATSTAYRPFERVCHGYDAYIEYILDWDGTRRTWETRDASDGPSACFSPLSEAWPGPLVGP
jgi:hypothetical protein